MSRKSRRRRTGFLVAAVTLAGLGAIDAVVLTPGGGARPELATVAAAQRTAVPSAPAVAGRVTPATAPAQTATPVPTTPAVVEKPPPVVDGVRRVDVGSAHSPRLLHQLASAPATMPSPADAGAVGVDVADYQHPRGAAINWPQVAAAGYKFAFIKATEGDYYANPYYASDLGQAKAAGLYATGYHFAVPNVSDGASQADYAVGHGSYTADGRTLPLALDIEYNPYGSECYGMSPGQMVSWISAFTSEARRLTGQRPIIYTTADWWRSCTGDSAAFGPDPLWIAAYRSGGPPMPAGWGNWTFWQYTSHASVPGIAGSVDVSYFLQAAVRLLDPSNQPPRFAATGLPPGSPSDPAAAPSSDPAATAPSDQATAPSGDASPTDSASPSDSATASPSGSPSPSASASPSPAPTDTTCATPLPEPSDAASPTASPTATLTASPCASPADSPSPADSSPADPSPSAVASPLASPAA